LSSENVEESVKKIIYEELIGEEGLPKRYSVYQLLTIILVALIAVGLFGIVFVARNISAPFMYIRDIGPNGENPFLNYAVVKVRGEVVSAPSISASQGKISIYFTINDSTGSIDVRAYDPVASDMIRSGKIPLPGYVFEGEVQVRVRENYAYLIIQSLETFDLKPKYTEPVFVTSLSTGMEQGYLVTVSGVPQNVRNVSAGWLFDLKTVNSTVTILVPEFIKYIDPVKASWIYGNLTLGAVFNITGVVYYYKGVSPEVVPRNIDDIVYKSIIPAGKAWLREVLSNINNYLNQLVTINAYLDKILYYSSGKYLLEFYDQDYRVNMTIDRTTLINSFNPLKIGSDSVFEINAYIDMNGAFTINSLKVVNPVEPQLMNIKDISTNIRGRVVRVHGTINSLSTTSGGSMNIDFSDYTGSIRIFIPSSTINAMSSEKKALLAVGRTLVFGGYVDIYQGILEIVVYHPEALNETVLTTPPSTTTTTPSTTVKINQLTNYMGSTVTITARLKNMTYNRSDHYYYLGIYDETGEAYLRGKIDIVSAIDPSKVAVDSIIRVTGVVKNIPSYGVVVDASSIEVVEAINPQVVSISMINNSWVGLIIGINVTIQSVRPTSGGPVFTVSDGSGTLPVFIPNSIYNSLPQNVKDSLTVDARVVFYGYIELYQNNPELVIYHVNGVVVQG